MSSPLAGKLIDDRYELLDIIGEGGMGVVYEGRHTALGRKVAVKILHEEFSDVDQASQRFMQEAQIAGNLGHANICEVTDVGTTEEGLPYMVMPFLEGRTLSETIEESEKGLSASRAVDIIVQVLSALQEAHEAGIVHRDLKPENIILIKMGDRADFVKVLDFGISKVVGSKAKDLQRLTATGMVLGTPYYMAPEQAAGAKDLDTRVDIYAVGVLLFELLVGHPPYMADSYNELIVKIVNEPVPRPREHNPDITKKLEKVVIKAMAKDRERRYDSARDFRQSLVKAGEDAGLSLPLHLSTAALGKGTLASAAAEVTDRMPTVNLHAPRQGRRRWAWLAGGIAAAALLAAIVFFSTNRRSSTPREPAAPAPPPGMRHAVQPRMAAVDPMRPLPPKQVTLRFEGLPPTGKILVAGKPIRGTEVKLSRSFGKVAYRAEVVGKKPVTGVLTPDRDHTVKLAFEPIAEALGMAVLPAMDAMGMPVAPPPMNWSIIRGRGGTQVKTNYDSED
ncbi:MAG: serine/threonine-protein kinase [bacterium]